MRAAARRGTEIPRALLEAPVLWPGSEVFWDAFWTLSWGRQIAMGFGVIMEQPIPYGDIVSYARARPWLAPGTPAFEVLERAVRAMDRAFISHMAERRKAEAAQKGDQPRRSGLILPSGSAT